MGKAVCGVYGNSSAVRSAMGLLRAAGFRHREIEVKRTDHSRGRPEFDEFAFREGRRVGEGATIGAIIGGVLGFVGGLLVLSGAFGPLFERGIPDFGYILVLTAISMIGVVLGMVTGALTGIGVPMSAERRYDEYVRDGGFVLAVHAHDEPGILKAREVLERTDAKDINAIDEGDEPPELRSG